ncbi:putative salicylate hydroxylase [Aureobasidium namibiae CBS 147.97]|uniref:Putative salicylate hydroxylase n=1 Tax=Aureobasidium namibiae CBS 147.97 TaxID=1043004 RepID=A0A074X7V1_9PEZI|nr:putative salicylate hydroxylase [Aureobasidium namibiae CBS 147.97]KEQ70681.1 putative salicylate hydroxylase [Aureobasidium namibiae CBS 147.97]
MLEDRFSIIGAGIAGLTLALSLQTQGISCAIYKSRPSPQNIGGAVMLSPNSLKLFDDMSIYNDLKQLGYSFDTLYFRDVAGSPKETYPFGSVEKYGYSGLRVYRYQLIDLLLQKLTTTNIPIYYNHKFSHVVSESEDTISSLLIDADGIHSRVRKYTYPELSPKFTGMVGITAAVPTANLRLPTRDYKMPVTIIEVLIGKQKRMPELSRSGWNDFYADKEAAVAFLREGAEVFGDIAVTATSDIPHEHINIWPFHVILNLPSWSSQARRVLLVGDTAHALPPSSGQGISQAVEDVVMLAMLLGKGKSGKQDLGWWQEYRQDRLEQILLLNARGTEEKDDEQGFDLDWLYGHDVVKEVQRYISGLGVEGV